jgi:hypothetical protein
MPRAQPLNSLAHIYYFSCIHFFSTGVPICSLFSPFEVVDFRILFFVAVMVIRAWKSRGKGCPFSSNGLQFFIWLRIMRPQSLLERLEVGSPLKFRRLIISLHLHMHFCFYLLYIYVCLIESSHYSGFPSKQFNTQVN